MFFSTGAPRRLPRSNLTDRWFSAAIREAIVSAAFTGVAFGVVGFLLNLAYMLLEPEKADDGWIWTALAFMVGAALAGFVRRAPMTRGSVAAEVVTFLFGVMLASVVMFVLGRF